LSPKTPKPHFNSQSKIESETLEDPDNNPPFRILTSNSIAGSLGFKTWSL